MFCFLTIHQLRLALLPLLERVSLPSFKLGFTSHRRQLEEGIWVGEEMRKGMEVGVQATERTIKSGDRMRNQWLAGGVAYLELVRELG